VSHVTEHFAFLLSLQSASHHSCLSPYFSFISDVGPFLTSFSFFFCCFLFVLNCFLHRVALCSFVIDRYYFLYCFMKEKCIYLPLHVFLLLMFFFRIVAFSSNEKQSSLSLTLVSLD
jgi:hypothetical protein